MFTCVPDAYGLNTLLCWIKFVFVNMSSKHPLPSTVCSEVMLCHCQCLAGVFCVGCDQSTLCYPHYGQPPIVICAVALYNHSIHPWSIILSLHSYCRSYRKRNLGFVSNTALKVFILSSFQGLIVFTICIEVNRLPINLGWHGSYLSVRQKCGSTG